MINVRMAAEQLDVAASTIRRWSGEFEEFLAPAANPPVGEPRFYTADDIAILNTILVLRGQRQPFSAIREALYRGDRFEPLGNVRSEAPPIAEPPPPSPVENQLVPYGMVERFMNLFEQSNSDRILAESKAAAEQARADMLQAQLDQLQGQAGAAGRPPQPRKPQPTARPGAAEYGEDGGITQPQMAVTETAPPSPEASRKGFFARAWAAWVYLIENKKPT